MEVVPFVHHFGWLNYRQPGSLLIAILGGLSAFQLGVLTLV